MKPNESHKAMNAFAMHLMDQVDLLVEDYAELSAPTPLYLKSAGAPI